MIDRSRARAGGDGRREPAPERRAGGPVQEEADQLAAQVLALQGTAGNRAVGRALARQAAPGSSADDPDFNPDNIVNDLRRAIDQSDTEIDGWETEGSGFMARQKPILVRSIHAEAVVEALDGRTAKQVARIAQLYSALETGGKRTLDDDLFGMGESGFPSVLTRRPMWEPRIRALMKGTKAETPGGPATDAKVEAVAAELAQVLDGSVDAGDRERICALHRRPPEELDRVYAAFERMRNRSLDDVLNDKLPNTGHRNRVLQLRLGNWAMADAIAIEEKRRRIEELDEKAKDDPFRAFAAQEERKKLSGEIGGILDMNRQEAMADPANAGKTADQAVNARLDAILNVKGAEEGQTLGSSLYATLGPVQGLMIVATVKATLVDTAAMKLLQMEMEGTTKTDKITPILRGFRAQAQHDVMARASDASVPPDQRMALASPAAFEAAVNQQAQEYTKAFVAAYDGIPGRKRSWQEIVDSADEHNTDLMNALVAHGGRLTDVEELDIAIRKKDEDGVVAVLKRQPHHEAVQALEDAYRAKRGKGLRETLFGLWGTAAQAAMMPAKYSGAVVSGREAGAVEEALQKPTKEQLGGQAEVDWLEGFGKLELQITEGTSGAMGALREIGDDPETQVLMNESASRLTALKAEWDRNDPWGRPRAQILAEMRRVRATLTGDATAYEEENARMVEQLRSAISMAVQIALAVALPGVGGGFIAATAINIGATVASNMIIYGDAYTLDRFTGDVLGGVTGAVGGKLGEELVGAIGKQVAGRAAKASAEAAEQAGVKIALGKGVGQAAQMADEASLAMKVALEGGNIAGSAAATTAVTGENQFTPEALLQSILMNQLGKIRGGGGGPAAPEGAPVHEGGAPPAGGEATGPRPAAEPAARPAEGTVPVPEPTVPAARPAGEAARPAAEAAPPASDTAPARPPSGGPGGPGGPDAARPEAGAPRREARNLTNDLEQVASHWPGMNAGERLRALERPVENVLAAKGVPPARLAAGEVNLANGAVFDFPTWSLRVHPDVLGAPALHSAEIARGLDPAARVGPGGAVGDLGNLVSHELEHAAQWWNMARLRAAAGSDGPTIAREMGIPADVAEAAWQTHQREGPIGGREAQDAQRMWDNIYAQPGRANREQILDRRTEYWDQVDHLQAQVDAQGANADPALREQLALTRALAEHYEAEYRAFVEEARAYATGDRAEQESVVMEAERQADLAETAAEHGRETVRDIEARLLDDIASGREPDLRLVAQHERELQRLRGLEDAADARAAERDRLTDERGGGPAPAPAGAAPAGAAPAAAAARGGGSGGAPSRPPGSRRTPREGDGGAAGGAGGRPPGGHDPGGGGPGPPGRPRIGDRVTSQVDQHSLLEGLITYHEMRRASPLMEAALVYDPQTGIYYAVQGGPDSIELSGIRREGLVVLRHGHPVVGGGRDSAAVGDWLPSTPDMGQLALETPPGEFRMEEVDFELGGGELGRTQFWVDKTQGRVECRIRMYHSGEVVLERTFNDIVEYQDFLGQTFDAPGQLPVGSTQVDPNADTDDY